MLTIEDYSALLIQNKPDLPPAEHDENGAVHFLQLESALLQRLMYKNCNQHKNTKYFGRLQQIRSRLRKLDLSFLERLLATFSQISSDEIKSHILGILFVHFKLFEEILELCAVAQPALSQLIEISNFMPFAIAMVSIVSRVFALCVNLQSNIVNAYKNIKSEIDLQQIDLSGCANVKKLLDRLGELPFELKSDFDLVHSSAKPKGKRSRGNNNTVSIEANVSTPTAVLPSMNGEDEGEELGETISETALMIATQPVAPKKPEVSPAKPTLSQMSKPVASPASKDLSKHKSQGSLASPDRANVAPKRKQPDVPEPVESAAKRPKVAEIPAIKKSDPKPPSQMPSQASVARPTKQPQASPSQPAKQQNPKKPTFSHSNPVEKPAATSFFSNKPAPAAPAPKKAAPSKAAKSMDQLFASLISSGKKKK